MANTTLGTLTLGGDGTAIIMENTSRKEAVLAVLPLYLNDSDNTDVFDFGGTIRTIDLSGKYIGGSISANKTFIDALEALIQGDQSVQAGYPLTFTDDLRAPSGMKVKIMECSSTMIDTEGIEQCTWTLKLVQSSTNA